MAQYSDLLEKMILAEIEGKNHAYPVASQEPVSY
jgi:hypothetical protein